MTELLDLGVCRTEEDAREKVASGEAPGLIKEAKLKLLDSEGLLTATNDIETG
jgi:hypothetical protein